MAEEIVAMDTLLQAHSVCCRTRHTESRSLGSC